MQFLDNEEGVLEIVGSTSEALQAAKDTVVDIITEPEEGTIYRQVWWVCGLDALDTVVKERLMSALAMHIACYKCNS